MALSITDVARHNGGTCDHLTVTINHEGVSRTFETSFYEIDQILADLSLLEQLRMLCILWAKYRRLQGRAIENVTIA
jgi:hypothetical protein